jgi:2',3'-cyclic-nucleotide 2'-phosphodiesterase/3'-nucleotidase/5'-nucleotidase
VEDVIVKCLEPSPSALVCAALVAALVVAASPAAAVFSAPGDPPFALRPIGTFHAGAFASGAAEIAAWDPATKRLYSLNNDGGPSIDVISIADPGAPIGVGSIDLAPYGAVVNSVAVKGGVKLTHGETGTVVAAAVQPADRTMPGKVVFFDTAGAFLREVGVGALPDMLTFTPDGRKVLVANEGEPNDAYTVDPEGTVSVINLRVGIKRIGRVNVHTLRFNDFNAGRGRHDELDPRIRIFGPNASVAQDLEPEYITVSADSKRAWVTLQENNALAEINLRTRRVTRLIALGFKEHSAPGNGIDASDRDDSISIANWPVKGMYQPDAIGSFATGGGTYLVTANEGDARDYGGLAEESRVGALDLDPGAFPDAEALQEQAALGRLTVTTANGDVGGDSDYDELYAFGARSFSIWSADGDLVFDSGDALERITAGALPVHFNSDEDDNDSFDSRSDNKGPEPEGLALGEIGGRTYAFIGLERIGGMVVFDVSDPAAPSFVQYVTSRDFLGDPEAGTAGDLAPEGVLFIPASESPNGRALVVTANEISGTVTIFSADDPDGAGTLSLLHNNDGESSLVPIEYLVDGSTILPVGGIAAFKTLTERQIAEARAVGNAVVDVYAGDALLASATLSCSMPPNPPDTPVFDAVAQRGIPYDAHVLGNHEFDFTPDFLERFIRSFEVNGVLTQPFLSANLDFTAEPGFADLTDADGLLVGISSDGGVVARSAIVTDVVTGQRFGIVGATTPDLPTISSPRNVVVTPDLATTAMVVQTEIDRLMSGFGVEKILFVSHLQSVANDLSFIPLLRGVDIAVAGGGDDLLVSASVPLETQLLPGELAPVAGDYPLEVLDADGRPVYIVTTAGNYKYLGRIDAEFDAAGEVVGIDAATSYPRRVIPESQVASDLGLFDAVEEDEEILETVIEPVTECLVDLQADILRSEVLFDTSRAGSRSLETNAGNAIADAFLEAYDGLAAENGLPPRGPANPVIAIQNGGGIRQNGGDILPVGGAPGTISRFDTLNVLPFFNTMTVVSEVTPADLKTIFERAAATLPGQGGQFLQLAGIRVTYDPSQTAQVVLVDGTITVPGSRVVDVTLDDGTPIVLAGVVQVAPNVRIVTSSFTAGGGDNYPTLRNNPDKTDLFAGDVRPTYESMWVDYLLSFPVSGTPALPTVPASDPRYQPGGEGRITILP